MLHWNDWFNMIYGVELFLITFFWPNLIWLYCPQEKKHLREHHSIFPGKFKHLSPPKRNANRITPWIEKCFNIFHPGWWKSRWMKWWKRIIRVPPLCALWLLTHPCQEMVKAIISSQGAFRALFLWGSERFKTTDRDRNHIYNTIIYNMICWHI